MFFGLFWRDFLWIFTTRFGLGPDHSPAGPGPISRVQVHPYLDLDPDIWGPVQSRPGSARSRTRLWTVYLYLMQQLLCCPTVTCIWYSNLPSSHLASLWNILCLRLCQFVFRYDEFLTTCMHLFYNPSSLFDTLRFAFVVIQALSWVMV